MGYTYQETDGKNVSCKTQVKIKANKDFSVQATSTLYSENDSSQIMLIFRFSGNYDSKTQSLNIKK